MATDIKLDAAQASIDKMNATADVLRGALPIAVAIVVGITIMAGSAAISGITTGGILSKIMWWILLLATAAGSGSAGWWTWQRTHSADLPTDKEAENK